MTSDERSAGKVKTQNVQTPNLCGSSNSLIWKMIAVFYLEDLMQYISLKTYQYVTFLSVKIWKLKKEHF